MDYRRNISLLNAIGDRRPSEVLFLLEKGADPNFVDPGADGNTPLHEAVNATVVKIVDLLLSNGALCDKPNYNGVTPRKLAETLPNSSEKHDILDLFKKHTVEKRKVGTESDEMAKKVKTNHLQKTNDSSCTQGANSDGSYRRRHGTSAIGGQLYESKLLALVYFRLSQLYSALQVERFQVGTNLDKIGNFDDIVVRVCRVNEKPEYIFVQAKYREDPTKRKASFKVLNTETKEDFGLHTNFKNYLDLRKEFGATASNQFFKVDFDQINVRMILYSPAMFEVIEESERNYFEESCVDEHDLFYTVDSGRVLNFRKYSPIVKKLVENARKQLNDLFGKRDDTFFASIAEDFLNKFFIYTNQAKQHEVGQILQQKIFKVEKKCNDRLLFGEFHAIIQKHWMDDKDTMQFLDENFNLLERTKNFITLCVLSQSYIITTEQCDITFKDAAMPLQLRDAFENNSEKLVNIYSSEPHLTVVKFVQYFKNIDLESYCIVDLSSTQKHFDIISAFSQAEQFDKLVVIAGSSNDCLNLRKMIAGNACDKKIVLLSSDLGLEPGTLHDQWSSLEYVKCDSQFRILKNTKINFQGRLVELIELIDSSNVAKSAIDAKLLMDILREESITLASAVDSSDFDLTKYVDREFGVRGIVKEEYLQGSFHIIKSYQTIPDDHKDIVVVSKSRGLYARVCQSYKPRPVHWFVPEHNHLVWQESINGLGYIPSFLDLMRQKFAVNTFNDIRDRVMILSAEPGMGKSTVLTGLTKHTEEYGIGWIIRINLLTYFEYFKEMNEAEINLQVALAFIAKSGFSIHNEISLNIDSSNLIKSFKYSQGRCVEGLDHFKMALFKEIYNDQKLIILVDGFDEIAPKYESPVLQMLNALKASNVAKLIVTTRNNTARTTLEESFAMLAHSLEPFTKPKIQDFFLKFWSARDPKVEAFVKELIKHFSKFVVAENGNFLGVPLHAEMAGTCFEQNFQDFCAADDIKSPLEFIERENFDLIALYEKFINFKMKIFFEGKSDRNIDHPSFFKNVEFMDFRQKHERLSLMACFDEEELEYLLPIEDRVLFPNDLHEMSEKQGLICTIINGKPQFVHLSFAEFFAANVVWKFIKTYPDWRFKDFCNKVLMENLVRYDRQQICRFVQLLSIRDKDNISNFKPKSLALLECSNTENLNKLSFRLLLGPVEFSLASGDTRDDVIAYFKQQQETRKMQLFTAFGMTGYPNLVRAFKGLLDKRLLQERLLYYKSWEDSPLFKTLEHDQIETAKIMMEEFEYDCTWWRGVKELMCDIMREVNWNTLKSLVKEGMIDCNRCIYDNYHCQYLPVIHLLKHIYDEDIVLFFLKNTNIKILNQNILRHIGNVGYELLDYSKSLTRELLNEGVSLFLSPHTIKRIFFEARFGYFKYFIKSGIGFDFDYVDKYKNSLIANIDFLKLTRNFCSTEMVSFENMILKSIVYTPVPKHIFLDKKKSKAFLIFHELDNISEKAKLTLSLNNLENFAEPFIVEIEQINNILDLQCVPNATKQMIESLLKIHQYDYFEMLCKIYDQKNVSGKLDEMIQTLEFITRLEKSFDDLVNAVKQGNKVIRQTLQGDNVESLVNCQRQDIGSPLAFAARKGDVELTELLLNTGANVNLNSYVSNDGKLPGDVYSPLHLAAYYGNLEEVQLLCKFGAHVDATTNLKWHMPLHVAVIGGHMAIVEYLLPQSSNINALNFEHKTPLALALEFKHNEIAQLLRDNNALEEEWTALHKAAFEGNLEQVKRMIEIEKVDPLVTARLSGYLPLHLAAKKNKKDVVTYLSKNMPSNYMFWNRTKEKLADWSTIINPLKSLIPREQREVAKPALVEAWLDLD